MTTSVCTKNLCQKKPTPPAPIRKKQTTKVKFDSIEVRRALCTATIFWSTLQYSTTRSEVRLVAKNEGLLEGGVVGPELVAEEALTLSFNGC